MVTTSPSTGFSLEILVSAGGPATISILKIVEPFEFTTSIVFN